MILRTLLYSLRYPTNDLKHSLARNPCAKQATKKLSAYGKATFLRTIFTRCFVRIAEVTFHIVDSVGANQHSSAKNQQRGLL